MARPLNDDRSFELMQDGASAYDDGRHIESNPWPHFSKERSAWQEGWIAAMNKEYYDE